MYDFVSCGKDVVINSHAEFKHPDLAIIGNHVAIDFGFYCTAGLEIGDYAHIASHVSVTGGRDVFLRMGHFTNLGSGCRIICAGDAFGGEGLIGVGPVIPKPYRDRRRAGSVELENFVNVGANVVILPGIVLGEGCVIGAGAVVTKSTEPWTIYVGVPAKSQRKRKSHIMRSMAIQMGYLI